MAAERENYRAAGAAGVKTAVLGVAAVVGVAQGAGALAAEGLAALSAARRIPRAYSVAFEAKVTERGIGTYAAHFAEANEQLLRAMGNPELAKALRQTLGANFESTILSLSGRVTGSSPAGWTWHHVPGQPGVLHLVPRVQHVSGSAWQPLLHPDGEGGIVQWGWRF
jgi:hypothetical protein